MASSPCGACKFLRRKCASDCVFAPYFCSDEEGPARFAAIHKVFGASNASKLLLHLPVADRGEAVATVAYEAQARLRDPVYGCVSHIFALQQQVVCLQAQLMQVKAELAQSHAGTRHVDQNNHMWGGAGNGFAQSPSYPTINRTMMMSAVSPQSSHESMDHDYSSGSDHSGFNSSRSEELSDFLNQSAANYCNISGNKKGFSNDLSELQALAFGIMRNT